MVEEAGGDSGIEYDHTVYEIEVWLNGKSTLLMNVPKKDDPSQDTPLYVHNYTITGVKAAKYPGDSTDSPDDLHEDGQGYYVIANSDGSKTFTNTISSVSWTPKATKVVEGGEMKEFTLQLATDSHFSNEDIIGTAVTSAGPNKTQTLSFKDKNNKEVVLKYSLSDIRNKPDAPVDSTGCGPSKTFTYYAREKTDGSKFSHYTYDHSVYKIAAKATVQPDKAIKCEVTYRKGTVDSDGTWKATDTDDNKFPDTTPTFTNTYSTSLPLSGMSGVTLTYLAGAAVLCAAAAWMHIRRKANAKGGERRE